MSNNTPSIQEKNIQEDYISFETAKLLKEKGFDELCRYYMQEAGGKLHETYSSNSIFQSRVFIPTQALVVKWLRVVHGIHIWLENNAFGYYWKINNASKPPWKRDLRVNLHLDVDDKYYTEPEEATESAILYCLKELL